MIQNLLELGWDNFGIYHNKTSNLGTVIIKQLGIHDPLDKLAPKLSEI